MSLKLELRSKYSDVRQATLNIETLLACAVFAHNTCAYTMGNILTDTHGTKFFISASKTRGRKKSKSQISQIYKEGIKIA